MEQKIIQFLTLYYTTGTRKYYQSEKHQSQLLHVTYE
jgi:hypothetical protein